MKSSLIKTICVMFLTAGLMACSGSNETAREGAEEVSAEQDADYAVLDDVLIFEGEVVSVADFRQAVVETTINVTQVAREQREQAEENGVELESPLDEAVSYLQSLIVMIDEGDKQEASWRYSHFVNNLRDPESEQEDVDFTPPKMIGGEEALYRTLRYPTGALEDGADGMVTLYVTVDEVGDPAKVRVALSSGHPLLDRAAVEAMSQMKFDPATQNGVAVKTSFARRVVFQIRR